MTRLPSGFRLWRASPPDSHHGVVALALAGTTLALSLTFGTVVLYRGWDNSFYLGQTSSLVEDGDLDLRNDSLSSQLPAGDLVAFLSRTHADGSLTNTFAIGPALFWVPAYLAALPLERALADGTASRWGPVERAALYLSTLVLTLAICWALFVLLCRAGVGPWLALLATITLLIGSPLLFYAFYDYTMSHQTSTLAACLFLAATAWLARDSRPRVAFLCGVALGLVYICRWQDVIMGIALAIPAYDLVRRRIPARRLALVCLAFVAGAVPVAALQSHAWWGERGLLLSMPQGSGYMHWMDPDFGHFLLSGYSGLVAWSPLLLAGTVGLALPWRCRIRRRWALVALLIVLVQVYVNAAVSDWWGGSSYGPRRMTSSLPLIALGVANLILLVPRPVAATGLLVISLWGVFTGNLALHGVRDLSLVFLGRPSNAPGTEREIPQPSAPAAQRIAARWPLVYRSNTFFPPDSPLSSRAGKLLTTAASAGVLVCAALLLAGLGMRSSLALSLVALFGLTLAAHARLAFGPPRDPAERLRWASLARSFSQPVPELGPVETALAADAAGPFSPHDHGDAVRFLATFVFLRHGDVESAERQIAVLERHGVPSAGELRRLLPASGDRLLFLIVGPLHRVARGGRYLTLAVPPFEPASEILHLELDFRPGPMRDDVSYPLLALRFANTTRAAISIGGPDGTRLDGDESVVVSGVAWHEHQSYRLRITWGEDPSRLRLEIAHRGDALARLETALLIDSPSVSNLKIVLGRPRQWRGEETLWGATYDDLRVEARTRR